MTLDDLIALNGEIVALVRAGVPLETGLSALGGDLSGRLGQYATRLAEQTARGQSLTEALESNAGELPSAYRAVVEAGLRAGRLPAALESVAASARRLADTYRIAGVVAVYPLLVILTAWFGLIFFACVLAPRLMEMFSAFGMPGERMLDMLARAGQSVWFWGPILPAIVLLMIVAWWIGRATGRRIEWLFGWMPWTGRMLRYSRTATFLETLSLLVENMTPLPEAVLLAGEASGDRHTLRMARQMAASLEDGRAYPTNSKSLPPLVRWLLLAAGRDGALLPAVRHAAGTYHRRARQQFDSLRILLPVMLTIVIGGGVTVLYALLLFSPYTTMLRSLSG